MKRIWILVLLLFFALPVCAEETVSNNAPTTTEVSAEDNSFDELTVEYKDYMENLQKNIKKNWNPPLDRSSKRVVLLFKISKDGKLLDCKVHQSSGNEATDKAAIIAVKKTVFEPLPKKDMRDSVDVQFTFDYNVFYGTEKKDMQLGTSVLVNGSSSKSLSPEYKKFLKNMRKRIKENWRPPVNGQGTRTIVTFNVLKDGKLANCKVHKSSGNKLVDRAALDAVEKSAPFDSLPAEEKSDSVNIQFTFDYYYYGDKSPNNDTPSTLVYKSTPNSQVTQIYKSMKNREDKKVFREYLEQVGRVLSFVQYDGDKKNLVRVKFTIDKAGLVTSAKVSASSGDKDFNNAILSKVKTLEFGEIPEQLKLEELPFEIEFNNCFYYNPLSAQNYAKANTALGAVTASSLLGLFIMSIIGF